MHANNAVGFYKPLATSNPDSFQDIVLDMPTAGPADITVAVSAISINPVDSKFRMSSPISATPRVLGYDACGTIVAVGSDVRGFAIGDRVAYAGDSQRAGSEQRYQAVDYRLVAKAPATASDAEAAALPLVSITAWELLFDKMGFTPGRHANHGQKLLIINGAGGVGSVLAQLARWTGLTVFATASPKHHEWLRAHGVAHPLDYHDDIAGQLHKLHADALDGIAILYAPEPYMALANQLIAPFGHVGTVVLPTAPLDVAELKNKAASLDFEYMFLRSLRGLQIEHQGNILKRMFALYDQGKISSVLAETLAPINAQNVRAATQLVENGHSSGKVVVAGGFPE